MEDPGPPIKRVDTAIFDDDRRPAFFVDFYRFLSVFIRILLQVHLRKLRGGEAAASFLKRGEGGTGKFFSAQRDSGL